MAKRLTDEEKIEHYFMTAETDAAKTMHEKNALILRVRGIIEAAPRPGRPRKKRSAGPLVQQADSVQGPGGQPNAERD